MTVKRAWNQHTKHDIKMPSILNIIMSRKHAWNKYVGGIKQIDIPLRQHRQR